MVMFCFHAFMFGNVALYMMEGEGGKSNLRNRLIGNAEVIGAATSTRPGIEETYNIPRIIHQTWKTQVVPDWAEPGAFSWKDKNPEYEYRIWDDRTAQKLIEERYPELLHAYTNYMAPVQRADVFRYAVIHAFVSARRLHPLLARSDRNV